MIKFWKRLLLHGGVIGLVLLTATFGLYWRAIRFGQPDFGSLPTNFVSNSVCFNAKLEHARTDNRLANAHTVILGSSIALNNLSGRLLAKTWGKSTYNFSSWGLKPYQSYEMLKQIRGKLALRRLIIPFNHPDFGEDRKSIDYGLLPDFLFANGPSVRLDSYLSNLGVDTFADDWAYRTQFTNTRSVYQSMQFDATGGVLFDPRQFTNGEAGPRRIAYRDTTGFGTFTQSLDSISRFCAANRIELLLVYMPWQRTVLSPARSREVAAVAAYMAAHYPSQFINLSGLTVSDRHYADCEHFFESGATIATRAVLNALPPRPVPPAVAYQPGSPD